MQPLFNEVNRLTSTVSILHFKQLQLSGGETGLLYLRDRLHVDVLQLMASTADNGHDALLADKELLLGEYAQGIIETKTLLLRPIIVAAAKLLVTLPDEFLISASSRHTLFLTYKGTFFCTHKRKKCGKPFVYRTFRKWY